MASCDFWFGTEDYMLWVPTPKRGADMSPTGWSTGGTLLNGGGWNQSSRATHREYVFSWGNTATREYALLLQAFRSQTYGSGLIYFVDPLSYDQNILPAQWSAPSITLDDEGPSLVYGVSAIEEVTNGWKNHRLPIKSARYDLTAVDQGFRGASDSVFIPIPEGYTLYLGAVYTSTGDGGIFASPVTSGTTGSETLLTEVDPSDTNIVPDSFSGVDGVRLWIGKTGATGSVTVSAITGRLFKTGKTPRVSGPWSLGMGHSGCRFVGEPTYVANTGVNGGQASVAWTMREVGSWV